MFSTYQCYKSKCSYIDPQNKNYFRKTLHTEQVLYFFPHNSHRHCSWHSYRPFRLGEEFHIYPLVCCDHSVRVTRASINKPVVWRRKPRHEQQNGKTQGEEGLIQTLEIKNSFMVKLALGFSVGASDKEPTCQCRRQKRHQFNPWVGKIPWRRAQQPTPVFLPGESPWTEEPGGLQSIGSQRIRHD